MNEIVKYQNDMNKLNFKGFTQMDMNIFMALCSQMKEKDTDELVMSFSKIKELTSYDKKHGSEEFIADLKRMNQKLMSVNCEIITKTEIIMFVLFPTFKINPDEETLKVAVNKDFKWLLNEMKSYTTFELAEFIDLKSKYSKNLYRLLKQWRTLGKYTFNDLSEFRELMDVPKSYTNRQLMQDCVSVAIEEISELDVSFKGFKCEPVYARKRGKPLDKLIFTWQAEKTEFIPRDEQLEGQQSFSDNQTLENYVDDYKNVEKDDIQKIVEMMSQHRITRFEAKKIYDSARGDLYHISKIYEHFKNRQADNFVGLMIAMVKPEAFIEPKKSTKKTGFHNFEGRKYTPEFFKFLEDNLVL